MAPIVPARVFVVGVVPDRRAGAGVHAVLVPHRSAAVAALAPRHLAGRNRRFGLETTWSFVQRRAASTVNAGVAAVGDPEKSRVGMALLYLLVGLAVVALVSLVIRFRRSRGEERQQLK
jgi:hypothetical protein